MKVKVLLFGSFIEKAGFRQNEMEFNDLDSLKNWLAEKIPGSAEMKVIYALNQEICKENVTFNEGDEIAVMPPFAGG